MTYKAYLFKIIPGRGVGSISACFVILVFSVLYKPWKCTVPARESFVLSKGPQANVIHAVGPINTTLQFKQSTDRTQQQRFRRFINVFPLLCCSLLHLHQCRIYNLQAVNNILFCCMFQRVQQSTCVRINSPTLAKGSPPPSTNL